MIMPLGAPTFAESLRWGRDVCRALDVVIKEKNFAYPSLWGDEGGIAPYIEMDKLDGETRTEGALNLVVSAIERAGYSPGRDVAIALDAAATEFFDNKTKIYSFTKENLKFDRAAMVGFFKDLCSKFPIVSIEDGMAEDDWEGWQMLTNELGKKVQLVGDDLFVTNPKRLEEGFKKRVANAILIKVNQIGTLSETIDVMNLAQRAGYRNVISHRSGETEDVTIADLAVAQGCGQIKSGSLRQSDRVAKYNQLLRIEEELGDQAIYAGRKALNHLQLN
jgi:enolase